MLKPLFAAFALLCAPALAQAQTAGPAPAQDSKLSPETLAILADPQVKAAVAKDAGDILPALELMNGKNGPADPARGMKRLRAAAEKGNELAALLLAVFLADGTTGIQRDPAESFKWYMKIASRTDGKSLWRGMAAGAVGEAYLFGRGVAKDEAAGIQWLKTGAESGDDRSMALYGMSLAAGNGVPRDPVQAARWLIPAADRGNRNAMTMLAFLYDKGEGVPRDPAKAISLYEAAAAKGSGAASAQAAAHYLAASPADPDKAFPFAEKAAQLGDPMGLKLTAELYRRGAGTPKNLERAAYWARIAALRGDDMAMVTLTMVYAESKGAVVSEIEAFEWMRKCDALGNATCSLFLGHAYQVGTATTPKDRDQAILYLRKAAAKGNATAKAALAELGAAP